MLNQVPDEKIDSILSILKARIPVSASVYNLVLKYPTIRDIIKLCTINDDGSLELSEDHTWIICITKREKTDHDDYCKIIRDIQISTPCKLNHISNIIKSTFQCSDIFSGSVKFLVMPHCHDRNMTKELTSLIVDVVVFYNEKQLDINLCYYYHLPLQSNCVAEYTETKENSFQLRPLEFVEGKEFMMRTWKFAKVVPSDYVDLCLERGLTAGLFIKSNQKPAAGVLLSIKGFISMLYTEPEHRDKGYGKVTMKYLIKQMLDNNYLPCSCVESENSGSKRFHESIGMEISHAVPFITCCSK